MKVELLSGESLHMLNAESIGVSSIFAAISECESDGDCVYTAEFDPQYGIPLSVITDHPPVEDGWSRTEVSDFRILP